MSLPKLRFQGGRCVRGPLVGSLPGRPVQTRKKSRTQFSMALLLLLLLLLALVVRVCPEEAAEDTDGEDGVGVMVVDSRSKRKTSFKACSK